MKRFITYSFFAIASMVVGHVNCVLAAELTKITAGVHPGFVRFVFHTDTEIAFERLETIDNSVRIVLDSATASTRLQEEGAPTLSDKFTFVSSVEYEQYTDGLLALIEMTKETPDQVDVKTFTLTPDSYGGHRLVVDIMTPDLQNSGVARPAPPASAPIPPASASALDEPDSSPAELPRKSTNPFGTAGAAKHPTAPEAGQPQTAVVSRSTTEHPVANTPTFDPSTAPDSTACETERSTLTAMGWNFRAAFTLAQCYQKESLWQYAASVFEEILERDPEFHRARLALAEVYIEMGQISRAKQAYLHVLATNPPAPVVKEIQDRINNIGSLPAARSAS